MAVAVACFAVVSAPKDASAVSLNLINNWRMGNMATLGNTMGTGSTAFYTGAGGGIGGGTIGTGWVPDIGVNIHFGIGLGKGDQVVPFLGFNVDRIGVADEYDYNFEGDSDLDATFHDLSMLVFGLEIGGKFFFIERAKGKAPPFLYVSFFKYFASIDSAGDSEHALLASYEDMAGGGAVADRDDAGALQSYDNARHSPLGFNLGFGAEYYFNDNFALGGTFLGVRLSYASAELVGAENIYLNTQVTEFNLYTNLSMTYRFSFSVRASVQFESDYDYED